MLTRTVAATRTEPGCDHDGYARDLIDPDLLRISDRWGSERAFEAHLASPHMAELGEALRTAATKKIDLGGFEAWFLRILLGG